MWVRLKRISLLHHGVREREREVVSYFICGCFEVGGEGDIGGA